MRKEDTKTTEKKSRTTEEQQCDEYEHPARSVQSKDSSAQTGGERSNDIWDTKGRSGEAAVDRHLACRDSYQGVVMFGQ